MPAFEWGRSEFSRSWCVCSETPETYTLAGIGTLLFLRLKTGGFRQKLKGTTDAGKIRGLYFGEAPEETLW